MSLYALINDHFMSETDVRKSRKSNSIVQLSTTCLCLVLFLMLHELLLHLAAHTSGLFEAENETSPISIVDFHPAEQQLLTRLNNLAQQHAFIRRICSTVCCSKSSIVSRNSCINSCNNTCSFSLNCVVKNSIVSAIEQELRMFNGVLCELEKRFLLRDSFFISAHPKFKFKHDYKQHYKAEEQQKQGSQTNLQTQHQTSDYPSSLLPVSLALLIQALRPWFRKMDYLEQVAFRFDELLNETLDDTSSVALNDISNNVSDEVLSDASNNVSNSLNNISSIPDQHSGTPTKTIVCKDDTQNVFSFELDVKLINQLSEDVQCYAGEIQTVASTLLCAAQKAWIITILPLMIGINLSFNSKFDSDFNSNSNDMLIQLPNFVSDRAANDILMTGRAMRLLRNHWGVVAKTSTSNDVFATGNIISTSSTTCGVFFNDICDVLDLSLMVQEQTMILSSLKYPLSAASLEIAVRQIKEMCAQRIFKHVLSLAMINSWVQFLSDYYLLQYSEFVFCFLQEVLNKQRILKISKQTQVSVLLIRTFKELGRIEEILDMNRDMDDTSIILHRRMLSLLISKDVAHNTSFSDLLIGMPVILSFSIPWPLTLFFFEQDVKYYSNIFSYLIAVKQAQTCLSELWRKRRCIIVTPNRIIRSHWAIASYLLYFLGSLWEYFQTMIIQPEYRKFVTSFSKDFNYDIDFLQALHQQFLTNLMKKLLLKNDYFLITLKKVLLSVNLVVSVIESSFTNDHATLQTFDEKLIKRLIKQILCTIEEGHTDIDSKLTNYLLLRMEF
ncbi:hypothetical protein PMAC_002735 [Pneumocystis sp. 'macacae']|nr:hypothetical protein PMAC_002735 [Pneumocystis sp. 'macacae']